MKLRYLIGIAAATFGLALAAQAAPAGPTPGSTALAWTYNGVTLVGGGHGGHGGGGGGSHFGGGGHFGGGHIGGGGNYSGPHLYSGSGRSSGSHLYSGSGSYNAKRMYNGSGSYSGQHIYKPHIYRRGESYRTYGAYGRHDGWHHHRRHWRGGWYGWGPGTDTSCFAECRAAGYSPAYCYANAWSFC
jgi:hypothetical protein